jgi:hypothetical protein
MGTETGLGCAQEGRPKAENGPEPRARPRIMKKQSGKPLQAAESRKK